MSINKFNRAFTIIELLIVIVIIEQKIDMFKITNGTYPTFITSCPTPGPTELCLKHHQAQL